MATIVKKGVVELSEKKNGWKTKQILQNRRYSFSE